MPPNNRPLAYEGVREVFDQALDSENGLKITCETEDAAVGYRLKMNKFRVRDREANRKFYPDPEHPMHGNSVYDGLIVSLKGCELKITKGTTLKVEKL